MVTIYATLGDDALIYGINESESNVIVTDSQLIPKLKNLFDQLHFIDTIIYFGEANKTSLIGFPVDVSFHSLREIEELGAKTENSRCLFSLYIPVASCVPFLCITEMLF